MKNESFNSYTNLKRSYWSTIFSGIIELNSVYRIQWYWVEGKAMKERQWRKDTLYYLYYDPIHSYHPDSLSLFFYLACPRGMSSRNPWCFWTSVLYKNLLETVLKVCCCFLHYQKEEALQKYWNKLIQLKFWMGFQKIQHLFLHQVN